MLVTVRILLYNNVIMGVKYENKTHGNSDIGVTVVVRMTQEEYDNINMRMFIVSRAIDRRVVISDYEIEITEESDALRKD